MTLLTGTELEKRWNVKRGYARRIPPKLLPRIDISGGGKRPTFRYPLDGVEAYERRFMLVGGR